MKHAMEADTDIAITDAEMLEIIKELFPICRSITGDGVRQTLRRLQQQIPLVIREIPSGTKVFDWTVPKEWNIRDAFIKNSRGEKVVDFNQLNLHVVNYSIPFRGKLSLNELKNHLFTLPDRPQWVPYRTSYYKESWGFCLSHEQLLRLPDDDYEVLIDASLQDGHLTYGECHLPGQTADEVLLSCHVCHPSLCNDNLSGIALMIWLFQHLCRRERRYSYRFLFIPGTIGSITWLALNEPHVASIKHGIVVAGVGDKGGFTYKRSRRGDAEIDRAFSYVLRNSKDNSDVIDFHPYGYDERQFCSPGFNLPVGCIMRTPFGQYPEYHTSADNLGFLSLEALADSMAKCSAALELLESNRVYVNQNPKCEPQLGRRGIYQGVGGQTQTKVDEMALLWVLNFSDGSHSLLDIAEKSGHEFKSIKRAADLLAEHNLVIESGQNRIALDTTTDPPRNHCRPG
jgi:aminopeptidase-like protein